jgi:hypothetical protein
MDYDTQTKGDTLQGIPEVRDFVYRSGIRYIPAELLYLSLAEFLRCIDDRRTASPERLGDTARPRQEGFVSFPGGALGLFALMLATLRVFMKRWEGDGKYHDRFLSAEECFAFARMESFVRRALGGMSCHTDEHSRDNPSACAGCGHMAALFKGGYALGETYSTQMQQYAKELKPQAENGRPDTMVDVYSGLHKPKALLRVVSNPLLYGTFVSIPPHDGVQGVFVINQQMNLDVIEYLMAMLYEEFPTDFEEHGILKEDLLAQARSLYFSHVSATALKLAHGLPVFDIIHTGTKQMEIQRSLFKC